MNCKAEMESVSTAAGTNLAERVNRARRNFSAVMEILWRSQKYVFAHGNFSAVTEDRFPPEKSFRWDRNPFALTKKSFPSRKTLRYDAKVFSGREKRWTPMKIFRRHRKDVTRIKESHAQQRNTITVNRSTRTVHDHGSRNKECPLMPQPTPMVQQYLQIKAEYKDYILLYRIGDFYEMFLDDAQLASRELEIVLTSKEAGKGERMPMCGIPYHAANGYISRLIEKGYKVAICEQVEDPKLAKGLVRREVVRVITPGTVLDDQMLQEKNNNFIAAFYRDGQHTGWAVADLSTGEFWNTQFEGDATQPIYEEIQRWRPREIIGPEGIDLPKGSYLLTCKPAGYFQFDRAYRRLCEAFHVVSLEGFGCQELTAAISASGALFAYLQETQRTSLEHITGIKSYFAKNYVYMDTATRRNLELTRTLREGGVKGSLLGVIDQTVTAAGARLLRQWVEQPLIEIDAILKRQRAVQCFVGDLTLRETLRQELKKTYDIQRLLSRLSCGSANARDLLAIGKTLQCIPAIRRLLMENGREELQPFASGLDDLPELTAKLQSALRDDPPITVKEGGIFRLGYNAELDELLTASREGRNWVAALEQKERERTGIRNLKVGFNSVFGYYIEITKANLSSVPEDYIRKQTLANAERYINAELKTYEEKILGAQEKSMALEYQLFLELRAEVLAAIPQLQRDALLLAELDVLAGLGELAVRNHYTQPQMNNGGRIWIKGGRHPVVEDNLGPGRYVPNDIELDTEAGKIMLITGPNMAGKSTIARSVLLITILAQIGSFIPAQEGTIGVVDRVYARVGASDDMGSGQSTFMVEMNELANIVNTATPRSLVLLDEVGRGTSTQDGLAIAWATVEYIHDVVGAKTMFTTHFHQLSALEGILPGVRNYHVGVKEEGDEFIFLHRLLQGGTDRSYGVEVARLAGLPKPLLRRAKEILHEMEEESQPEVAAARVEKQEEQIPLFTADPIRDELSGLDLIRFTPLDALNYLFNLKERLAKGGKE